MNFLALCKRVHLILRVGEETPGTQPTEVTGQTSVLAEIVQHVAAAHDDICRRHPSWLFLDGSGEFPLPTGARIVAESALAAVLLPNFGSIKPFTRNDYAYLNIKATGVPDNAEQEVVFVPYQQWSGNYDVQPIPTGQPTYFTIRPDGGVEFDSIAERDYTLRTNYRKTVTVLAADADEPMFGDAYHMTIVWWAIRHYYCVTRDGTTELLNKANIELSREWSKLQNEQLPDFTLF